MRSRVHRAPSLQHCCEKLSYAMQGVQAPPPGSAGAAAGEYQPPAQVSRVICQNWGPETMPPHHAGGAWLFGFLIKGLEPLFSGP